MREALGFSENDFVILAVGRLTEQKNYSAMLNVMSNAPDDYRLIICGDGEDKDKLLKQCERLSLSGPVLFFGTSDNVRDLYFLADVLLLTSLWEGFPMVILESMSAKLVVVATPYSGIEFMASKTGNLGFVTRSYAVADVLDTLSIVSGNSLEVALTKNRAYEYVLENFSMKHVAKKWRELYFEICSP
jgi:glycosyltransferase involved in cell wall biosynthesis